MDKKEYPWHDPITFEYVNWRGVKETRTVIPFTIWYGYSKYHEGNQWFLKGFDLNRNDERDFAMKDIVIDTLKPF